jgi:hypothetical protein
MAANFLAMYLGIHTIFFGNTFWQLIKKVVL